MAEEYISLRPSDAVHGGGMIAEGDYDIVDAKFVMFDYNGTVQVPVPALAVEFKNADDVSGVQYYTAGDLKNVAPTEDGKRLKKVGSSSGLNDSTNCFAFLVSLINGGFSEDKIANDISVVVGTKVSLIHQAVAERDIKGKKVSAKNIAVISKVLQMPGGAVGKAAKATTAGSKKTNGTDTAALGPAAQTFLVAALKEANGAMEKKKLTSAIFSKIPNTDPNRSAILNLIIQDEFLSSLTEAGVLYDASSGNVIYAGA